MYNPEDIIAALSSPPVEAGHIGRSILRTSGTGCVKAFCRAFGGVRLGGKFTSTVLHIDGIDIDADILCFRQGHSYTGEEMVELHALAAAPVVELLLGRLLEFARLAGPGEFTLRAYLNGRLDLSQAEAVAEIVSGAGAFQVAAAQRLLAGGLARRVGETREKILDLLILLEAGMDFSTEDIEFISPPQARERLKTIRADLSALLAGPVRCEEMISLPRAALAGAVNAGKSTLLNTLLGVERSIVSGQAATTRDVLGGVLELDGISCVLMDCAGLMARPAGVLDELANRAALEALENCDLVLFCVDTAGTSDDDAALVLERLRGRPFILVGTKADMHGPDYSLREWSDKSAFIRAAVAGAKRAVVVSAKTSTGLDKLRAEIADRLLSRASAGPEDGRVTLTRRHRDALEEAAAQLGDAVNEIDAGRDELAAMFLRRAHEVLGGIEREDVNEEMLGRIFSRFCIGK